MADTTPRVGAFVSLEKENLQQIFDALRQQEFTLIGPTVCLFFHPTISAMVPQSWLIAGLLLAKVPDPRHRAS